MKSVKVALLASALLASAPASAASYLFDINIGGTTGSGSFTTVGDASTGYTLINSLTGTFGGGAISLLAPGTYPTGGENDNLFREAPTYFTFNGLSFSANGINYNIYTSSGSLRGCSSAPAGCGRPASFSLRAAAAVPEPGTWMMMLLGFGVVGGALRSARRHRTTAVTYA